MTGRSARVEDVLAVLLEIPGRRADVTEERLRQMASDLLAWYALGRLAELKPRAVSHQRRLALADLEKLERLALRLAEHIGTMDPNAALALAQIDPEGHLHGAPLAAKMARAVLEDATEGEGLEARAPNKVAAQIVANRLSVLWREVTGAPAVRTVVSGYEASPLVDFIDQMFAALQIPASAQSQVRVLRKQRVTPSKVEGT